MNRLCLWLLLCLAACPALALSVGDAEVLELGHAKRVWEKERFQPDGSMSVIKQRGQNLWIVPLAVQGELSQWHYYGSGDSRSPLSAASAIRRNSEIFRGVDFAKQGNFWILNTYQVEDGILAFIHIEQAEGTGSTGARYSTGKSRIGLGWSTDDGRTFRFLGNIIIPTGDPDPHNVQGVPYIVRNGNFFIYYHDSDGNTVATAPVAEVLNAARDGRVSSWRKFNGPDLGFSSDGLGGPSKSIGMNEGVTHTDAACSTVTGKCYMLVTRLNWSGKGTAVVLYESEDGTRWRLARTLVSDKGARANRGFQYATIVNESGSDNAVVGRRFYVYIFHDHQDSTRRMVRWSIDLSE